MSNSNNRLSTKAGYLIVSNAFGIAVGFLSTLVIVRFLNKSEFGTFKQVQLVYAMLAPIFVSGMPASLLYFIPQFSREKQRRFATQTLSILQVLGVIFFLIMFFGSEIIAIYFNNPALKNLLIIYSFFALFALPSTSLGHLLMAKDKYKLASFITAAFALTGTLAYLIPIVLGYSLNVVFKIVAAVALLLLIYSWIHTKAIFKKLDFSIDWRLIKRQFAYAIPLGLSGVMGMLSWNTDRLMVSLFFKPALFAIYVIGAVEVPLMNIINASVNSVLIPRFSTLYTEGKMEKIIEIWHEAIRKTSLIMLPSFFFLFAFSYPIVTFLYTDRYASSVPIFRVYLLLLPLRVATYSLILQATGNTKDIMKGSFYYLIFNILLNYTLIKLIGLIGPAIATVIATFALATYYLIKVKRIAEISIVKLFPWKVVGKVLLLGLLATGVSAPILLVNINKLFLILIGGITFSTIFILISTLADTLTEEDRKLVKDWLLLRPLTRGI